MDLRRYTRGFTNKPPVTYTVSNVSTGIVTLVGGTVAHYEPPTNYAGRASFNFTVTDADGSTWTQPFLLLMSAVALPQDLLWKGDGASNLWDTNALSFVRGSGAEPTAFRNGDSVTFDDTGDNSPFVQITGSLQPYSVAVNNASKNYTFGGSGLLSGVTTLAKSGVGALTVSNANTFSGGTVISGGAVVLAPGGKVGTGTITLQGGTLTSLYGGSTDLVLADDVIVPTGETGTVNLSPRMAFTGASGGGALNVNVTGSSFNYDRFNGVFATFTGTLNVTGSVGTALLTVDFNTGGFDGNLGNARVNLDNVTLMGRNNSWGNTLYLGALSGSPSAVIGGSGYVASMPLSVGGLGLDTTFAGTITDGVGPTALTKTGVGLLSLTGTNTHSGTTTVSVGTLAVDGIFTASPVTVASNAVLTGNGILGAGATVQSGGILAPVGLLTSSNTLALSSATLRFDLTASPAGANDRIALSGGTLALTNTQNLMFTLTDGYLGAGSYPLVDGGGGNVSSNAALAHNLPAGTRQTFTLTNDPLGQIVLEVSGDPGFLTWTGTNGSAWDAATVNWLNSGLPDTFVHRDAVTFNDSSTNGTVTVGGPVEPRSVTVSNAARAYTLGGGAVVGDTGLTKLGSGTLTLSASNNFGGGLFLNGGTVLLANDTANAYGPGTGPVTFNGGTLTMYDNSDTYNSATWDVVVPAGQSGTLTLDSRCDFYGTLQGAGTLNLKVAWVRSTLYGNWSAFTGQLNVGPRSGGVEFRIAHANGLPAASVNLSSNVTAYPTFSSAPVFLGDLAGSGGSVLGPGNENGVNATWVVGGKNTSTTFAGSIRDAGVTKVVKTGTGTWTLTGSNSFSGGLVVSNGTLLVNNTTGSGTGSGAVSVLADATLGGTGTLAGPVTIETDATLSPGTSIGRLTIGNSLTLAADSTTFIELNKTLGTNDVVLCSGAVKFDGELVVTNLAGTLAVGDSFKIFNTSSRSGNFSSITGPSVGQGRWEFNPASGTLTLVAAFPPGTAQYEARVEFNNYPRSEVLTDFPVLVTLGNNIAGFDYGTFLTPDGSDLRFRVAGDTNLLNYEVDTWNPAGDSRVWVQVPAFSNQCAIVASWGDTGATNRPASVTNGATWSAGYVGVWHLAETNASDSTARGHGAVTHTASAAAGLVGNAATYDGLTNLTRVPFHSDFNLATNFEVQGWFKVAAANKPSSGNYLVLTSKEASPASYLNRNWWLALRSDGKLWWKSSPSLDVTNNTDLADGAWHHFSAVHEGAAARFYIDGLPVGTDGTPGVAGTQSYPVYFGAEDGSLRFFKGPLDEMRISNISRSSNWVWATHQTIANSGFATYGPAEIVAFPVPPSDFSATIQFNNYNRSEVLTNLPLLVVLGTNIPGFSYDQFYGPNGADLRFTSAAGTNLNYEVDTWNPTGESRFWVQVPVFSNNCSIIASWGNIHLLTPPASTVNGSTWSEGYLGVWHLRETSGPHLDSSPALATSRFLRVSGQGSATGIIGACDNFSSSASNYVSLPDMGTNPAVTVECWANLNSTPGGADIGLVSSIPWGVGYTHFKVSNGLQLKVAIGGAGTVVSSNNLLSVGDWFHAAYTIGGTATNDLKLYHNAALLGAASGRADNNLTDVTIAREYDGRYLNARVDEVRISSVARSSNWLWAVYQNIVSNSTFNSISSVSGVAPPAPTFNTFSLTGGQPTFEIGGWPGYTYTVEASTNLVSWTPLLVTNPAAMPLLWTDAGATHLDRRFYRVGVAP